METLTIRREVFPILFRNFHSPSVKRIDTAGIEKAVGEPRLAQGAKFRLLRDPQATSLMHLDRSRKSREELDQSDYGLPPISAALLLVAEQRYRMRFVAEFVAWLLCILPALSCMTV